MAEADSLAAVGLQNTLPGGSTQIGFTFRIKESDLRFTGRGVARIQPPYRVRLDLFTPQGENLFQAALVEGDLRIPDWAPRALAPPAPLLWAAVGVFRPDPSLVLAGARRSSDGAVLLRYDLGSEGELRFRLSRDRLLRAELRRDGHLEEEVDLSYGDDSKTVVETVYRNQARFLEMTFSLETIEDVGSFPPDIWYPGL
jgi:hypothetical protein